ncbi:MULTISPECIES: Gfo/Idh/MocA family oxidoreductase [unclassified Erwinia]|uniref:Gfo/Idh/MocA family oxidoreductase n=1 Tax=unclassified Erwinia TaxID=2622719 RepID=UPI000A8E6934|nr:MULTISPECIES: Gfo/Idh/MocA family oxidoreductase [unclassified Erwinia]
MSMTEKLTIGFIGNGKSTNRYHLPFVLTRADKIAVKTIYARRLTAGEWPRQAGVDYTDDLQLLLGDPAVQLVVITTPSASHFSLAEQVLLAGKHCVVEKPFTATLAEAERLFALAAERGLMIQCYQNRRFDSDYLTTRRVIDSGVLGELLELEMHYDYFRPEVPQSVTHFSQIDSYLYGHGCHTLDQVIAWFGEPDRVHYDVRQLLGPGRMNDYFDVDLYYRSLKVSVKSSYFRVKERPSFVVYGSKGTFVKHKKDRQEEHLKLFYLPHQPGFGLDTPEEYGVLSWVDEQGVFHEQKVVSERGDYARYYDALYDTLIHGQPKLVSDQQTLLQIRLLEEGIQGLS